MSLYSLKIKDTKVAVISDPARWRKDLQINQPLVKNKGMLFDFKKEQKVTMNMKDMNYPLIWFYQQEVVARSLKPGNFTSVEGVRFYY
jgi:uncharacterized membrane protein (UPF0127 family)